MLDLIERILCKHFLMDKIYLFKRCRKRNIIKARQLFFYLSYTLTSKSYSELGKHCETHNIKSYDHTTVLHACKKFKGYTETYTEDKYIFNELKKLIINEKDVMFNPINGKYELESEFMKHNPNHKTILRERYDYHLGRCRKLRKQLKKAV